jgi:hypothetical protein
MASITRHRNSIESSRRHRADTDEPANLLVFACVGLLIDVLALLMLGAAPSAPLGFVLIAGAAPVAALIALWLARHADPSKPMGGKE